MTCADRLYDHIQRLSFSYHDQAQSGQLISRCIEDVRAVQNFTGNGFMMLVRVVLCWSASLCCCSSPTPAWQLFHCCRSSHWHCSPPSFGSRIGKLFYKVEEALGDLSSRLQENVSGAQVVRAFAREEHEIKRFRKADRHLFDVQLATIRLVRQDHPCHPLSGRHVHGRHLVVWRATW